MGLKEFRARLLKLGSTSKSAIRNSWGVYDAFKYIRKNKWFNIGRPLKENEFYGIIRTVNNMLAHEIGEGRTVKFPYQMGCLEIRKYNRGPFFKDGVLRVSYPVNWYETIKLWYEDSEARKNKTLLRNESKLVYTVRYNKFSADFENKIFYGFVVNRNIKKALKKNIEKGLIETLW